MREIKILFLSVILIFIGGLVYYNLALAREDSSNDSGPNLKTKTKTKSKTRSPAQEARAPKKENKRKVTYEKRSILDFEGADIQGELKTPGEYYFNYRPDDKAISLVESRKNFHREMMRDVVRSK